MLIVGLGNPEDKYVGTRHNAGFAVADKLLEKLGRKADKRQCHALVCETYVRGVKTVIAKPLTYMNLSGESVRELLGRYNFSPKEAIIVYDDIDLQPGAIRYRDSGSAGTHNGMRNIVQLLGTSDFPRVRVGIGKDTPMSLMDYVLSQVTDPDRETLEPVFDSAAAALYEFVNGTPLDQVMQKHNIK